VRPGLALALASALCAHGLGLAGGFVYDDHRFVEHNQALARAPVTALLLDPSTHSDDSDRDIWRPLRVLGHAFDRARWGLEPFGYHLHSLLVHLLCVALAFHTLRRLLPEPCEAAATFGALLLAAHPLGVEVVGWITSRGDLYALAFALPALWLAVASDRDGHAGRAVLAGGLALLAMLGKESAVWLPLVALAHRRLFARPRPAHSAGTWALATGAAVALLLRQVALGGISPVQTAPHGGSLWMQAAWALSGTGRTLSHLAWPATLAVEYSQAALAAAGAPWNAPSTWLALGAIVAACALRRSRPTAAFLMAWALLAYLPSSSLLVTLRALVNDRAAYPMLVPAGALLGTLLERRRPGVTLGIAFALSIVLVPLSVQRTRAFHDDASLWQDVLRHDAGNVRAHLGLAAVSRDLDLREAHLREAVRVATRQGRQAAIALAHLGDFLLHARQDPESAVPILHAALELQRRHRDRAMPGPEEAATGASLAEALTWLGRTDEADHLFALLLHEQPSEVMLHVKRAALALWRWESQRDPAALDDARIAWQQARAWAPDHPVVRALELRITDAERTRAGS
jgi:tetratricopeptide (TPR) repeat protein